MQADHGTESPDDEAPTISCCAFLFGKKDPLSFAEKQSLSRADSAKSTSGTKDGSKPRRGAAAALELIFSSSASTAGADPAAWRSGRVCPPEKQNVAEEIRTKLGWELGKVLGSGHFASVQLGRRCEDGKLAAVKVIERKGTEKEATLIRREIEILKRVDHPYCVRCFDTFETADRVYLFMELMEGGELFDAIVAKGHYSEGDAQGISYKLLSALEYLHAHGIVHRDLKPENMLLTSNGPDAEVKITDFGLGRLLDEHTTVLSTACGTPGYIAPEVLHRRGYGAACDIWSLGVIVYILLCGFPPFYADNDAQLFRKIKAGEYEFLRPYWDSVSSLGKDFVAACLRVDPKARPDAKAMMAHEWLSQHHAEELARQEEEAASAAQAAAEKAAAAKEAAAKVSSRADSFPLINEPLHTPSELSKLQAKRRLKAAFIAARWAAAAAPAAEEPE